MPRKKPQTKAVAFKIVEASAILGMKPEDLELALDMLRELQSKMNAWEKQNGLRKEK